MKYILLLFLTLATLTSCSTVNLNPKIDIDTSKALNVSTSDLINNLEKNGFYYTTYKNYLSFEHPDYKYLEIRIYTENSLINPYTILVYVLLHPTTENKDKINNYKAPLNKEYFSIIQTALQVLPCNEDKDFLKSNFQCKNNYSILYSIHKDSLNKIRSMLNIAENNQLVIEIKPA